MRRRYKRNNMPNTNDMIMWFNELTSNEKDIYEIADAGVMLDKPDKSKPGKTYKNLDIGVLANGKTLTWTPDTAARNVFIKKKGPNTEAWVGLKFQVKHYPKKSFGKDSIGILPVLLE